MDNGNDSNTNSCKLFLIIMDFYFKARIYFNASAITAVDVVSLFFVVVVKKSNEWTREREREEEKEMNE